MAPDFGNERPPTRKRSGNYRGRKPGSKNRRYRIWREAEPKLMKRVLKTALQGDALSLKIIGDRIWPRVRPESAPVRIPEPSADLAKFGQQILTLLATGRVSPDTASDVLQALAAQAGLVQHTEFEQRLAAIEKLEAECPDSVVQAVRRTPPPAREPVQRRERRRLE